MCRSGNLPNRTCAVERYHPPTCHPDRNEMERRDLLKWQALPYAGNFCNLGRFLHSADATVGMTDVFCVDWYKFKCTTYMAADCRRYTRFEQRNTQCSGDDSSPCHVANRTCVDEWNHLPTCHPDRNEMKWRDLPKWQSLPCVDNYCNLGRFLHSADAKDLNDRRFLR